ncbi:hypothetical protein OROMI_026101 [Orobanche minor]
MLNRPPDPEPQLAKLAFTPTPRRKPSLGLSPMPQDLLKARDVQAQSESRELVIVQPDKRDDGGNACFNAHGQHANIDSSSTPLHLLMVRVVESLAAMVEKVVAGLAAAAHVVDRVVSPVAIHALCRQDDYFKNEAILEELSMLKWQERATKLVSENNTTEIADIQAAISSLEAYVKSERDKIQENSKTLKELEALHVKYMKREEGTDNDFRRSRNEEFERQNLKDREDFNHLKKKIKKLDDKLERLCETIAHDATKIVDHTKECEDSVIEIPKLEEKIGQLQTLLVNEEKILEEIEENSKGHDAGRAAYEDAKKKIVEVNATVETKTLGVKDIENELVKIKSEASEARKVEQALLEEQHKLVFLEQAARQKEANDIPGIYGRMGDLGAIDEKKQAYYLPRMREKIDTPEAVGNIIVAKDIDQATHIAYGGRNELWRVVTLDGAIFEKSGTMTGGGNRPSGGQVGTSIRASASRESVANAEKELPDLVERLKNLRNRISDAVKNYRDSEKSNSNSGDESSKNPDGESLKLLLGDQEKQLGSLEAGSRASEVESWLSYKSLKASLLLIERKEQASKRFRTT